MFEERSPSFWLLASSTVAFFAYLIVTGVISHRRHAARAKELGCELAPLVPTSDPSGFYDIILGARCLKEMTFPILMREMTDFMAQHCGYYTATMRVRLPGFQQAIFTVDPRNIQAMLALQFKEFDFGYKRVNSLKPLLGTGIVSLSGERRGRLLT